MQIKDILDIKDLLQRFPGGFAVTPSGKIMEIVSNFQDPLMASTITPPRDDSRAWGFLVVAFPIVQNGDSERFEKKRISVQDFFMAYDPMVFHDEEELKQTLKNLNEIGVGVDQPYIVVAKKEGNSYKLVLEVQNTRERVST